MNEDAATKAPRVAWIDNPGVSGEMTYTEEVDCLCRIGQKPFHATLTFVFPVAPHLRVPELESLREAIKAEAEIPSTIEELHARCVQLLHAADGPGWVDLTTSATTPVHGATAINTYHNFG